MLTLITFKIPFKLVSIFLILSLCAAILSFPHQVQAANTTVSASTSSVVSPGQTFAVNVSVAPGTDIAGVQFDLEFDGALLSANGVQEGGLLSQGGATTFFNPGGIGAGSVSGVAGAIITPGETVSGAGTFATVTLTAGTQSGTSPLTLTGVVVGDSNGSPVPISVSSTQVTINGNQPPALGYIGDKMVEVGQLLQFTISASDPDGDSLTYSASNLPPGATFESGTRVFSWTSAQEGTYSNVHFEVTDGEFSDSENITITAGDINHAPKLDSIGNQAVAIGDQLQFTVFASDIDGDSLAYSAINLPMEASFDAETRIFSWIPSQSGIYEDIFFEVTDGQLRDSESITIMVGGDNASPELGDIGDKMVPVGQLLQFTVSASDPDGDSLTYSVSNLPVGANFDPGTRVFSWIPSLPGTYTDVCFETSDGQLSDSLSITIIASTPAVFSLSKLDITPDEVDVGQEVTISLLATNNGDVAGSYEVKLTIDGEAVTTQVVTDLAAGTSQTVFFTTTATKTGTVSVDAGGLTGSFTVGAGLVMEISQVNVTSYYTETSQLAFAEVSYEVANLFGQIDDVELALKVSLNGRLLEEVPLALGQLDDGRASGSYDYVPQTGWAGGTYTFQVEMIAGDFSIYGTAEKELTETVPAAAPTFRWALLGGIIGGTMIVAGILAAVLIRRRRPY
jgi:hypothetical protein